MNFPSTFSSIKSHNSLYNRKAKSRAQLREASAKIIQRTYRSHLRRMYGSALAAAFLANNYLKFIAAKLINAAARGRLARRIASTERALLVLKSCHPLLIRYALRPVAKRPKVFWYRTKYEVDLLFANYLELVEKTGFQASLSLSLLRSSPYLYLSSLPRLPIITFLLYSSLLSSSRSLS